MQYLLTPHGKDVVQKTFAGIGFIVVLGTSFWLAAYAITNLSPAIVSRVGSAAVYLGAIFVPNQDTSPAVIDTATSTPLIAENPPAETTVVAEAPNPAVPVTAGEKQEQVFELDSETPAVSPAVTGLPDLIVSISAVGYLATTSPESFITSSTAPFGTRPAVRFVIRNQGTNFAGTWRFNASIPTQSSYLFYSPPQQPLAPGDSVEYTLGFDQAAPGTDKIITISANFDHAIGETTYGNNNASAKITILGY